MRDDDLLRLYDAARVRGAAARGVAVLAVLHPDRSGDALARLPLGRRNALLLRAWRRELGEALEAVARCAGCGEGLELVVPAVDLLSAEPGPGAPGTEVAVRVGAAAAVVRLPDSVDLELAGRAGTPDGAQRVLLRRCLLRADTGGRALSADELPADLAAALADALAAADPLAVIRLDLGCPACGASTDVLLDPAGLWWAEVERRARRTLTDVHRLATAYGWSERDILALGPARRAAYLELVS